MIILITANKIVIIFAAERKKHTYYTREVPSYVQLRYQTGGKVVYTAFPLSY